MITNPAAETQVIGVKAGASRMTLVPAGLLIGTLGPSNALWVDGVYGVDATGQRGNQARPFLTIQAALNATQTGDQVIVAPQAFAVAAPLTIPATTTKLSVKGGGSVNVQAQSPTQLTGAPGISVWDLGANLGLSQVMFEDLAMTASGAGAACVKADGSLYAANQFTPLGVTFSRCGFTAISGGSVCFALKYARIWQLSNCYLIGTTASTMVSSSTMIILGGSLATPITIDYDGTDPLRTTTQNLLTITGGAVFSTFTDIIMSGQSRLRVDAGSSIDSLTGNNLSVTGAIRPSVLMYGGVGVVDFQTTAAKMLPDTTANSITLDFTGATFTGGSVKMEVTAPATAQAVQMAGARSTTAFTLTANAGINVSAKGQGFRAPTYITGGTGTIDPGVLVLAPLALAGNNQAAALGFTSPVTTYVPDVTIDTLATGPAAANTFTAVGFNVQTAAGGGNARITINWP